MTYRKLPHIKLWCLKRRNCYRRNVNVTHAVAYLHFHLPKFIGPENWLVNSQYLSLLTFQCRVLCNRSCIVRSSETLAIWSAFCSTAGIR